MKWTITSARNSKIVSFFLFGLMIQNAAYAIPSGDVFVDGGLVGYQTKRGGSDTPTLLNPSNYTNGVDKCSSTAAESHEINCPSDLFYTPNQNTGGHQAFGVGATEIPSDYGNYAFCYFMWTEIIEPDYPVDYYWDLQCEYFAYVVLGETRGRAIARIKFGTDTTTTATWGNKPMSTLAFKANNTYLPANTAVSCDPDTPYLGGDAPCDSGDDNVYAIPSVGYEDKILMTDDDCTPTIFMGYRRAGDHSDAALGCFTHYQQAWDSDMPSPYLDTTKYDTAADIK